MSAGTPQPSLELHLAVDVEINGLAYDSATTTLFAAAVRSTASRYTGRIESCHNRIIAWLNLWEHVLGDKLVFNLAGR